MRLPLLTFLPLLLLSALHGQDCYYQLQLTDQGGDGWNGGEVTVSVDDVTTTYTLDATNDDGARRDLFFPVTNGAEVRIGYRAGAFPEEVGFSVLDNNDSLLYTVQAPATNPTLNTLTASCRTCAPPPLSSIDLYRVRYNSVDIRFRGTPGAPTYVIRYGPAGVDPESEDVTRLATQDTMLRVSGLDTQTAYDFYIETECAGTDETSVRRGPFRIRTQIRRDVGVTMLRQPVSGCQHDGMDSLTVGITNFGGEAQQFIRINFTVNGEDGGVNFPFDGIYTGVLGVDSTKYFTFDTQVDLSEAGYYEIRVWTELEDDQATGNDTLTATVVSLPKIDAFPYVETFETDNGFWLPAQGGAGPVSWARARPRAPRIDRAGAGAYAYVTNATGTYNDDELSYLSSPCFDFTGLNEDPYLSFLLYVDTEAEFDGLYLQSSTDGGRSWRRLPRNATGINWYNNGQQRQWDGDGGFGGRYALVEQQLAGLAGADEVRLRFVFESDGDNQREGVSIDNVRITRRQGTDYAAVRARLSNAQNCGERIDTLAFTYTTLGGQPVDSVTVSYSLNGGPEVSARAPAPRVPGTPLTYRFPEPVTTDNAFPNRILFRVTADGDMATYNDTLTYVYPLAQQLPFLVDFEDGRRPDGWEIPADLTIARRAGTPSLALTDNLNGQDGEMNFTTAAYGDFQASDTLTFTLRLRDADGNPVAGGLVGLTVDALQNCPGVDVGETLIDLAAVPADSVFQLTGLTGSGYRFTFTVTGGSQDVFVTFDDFGVRRCPADLNLRYATDPPSGIFADDGTAYVLVGDGLSPYTYAWSNGDTTQSADSLSVTDYTVTVTDAVGCTDQLAVSVDLQAVSTDDPFGVLAALAVFPNPTAGRLEVQLELPTYEAVRIELFDGAGRRLEVRELGRRARVAEEVDLRQRPAGVYFVRVTAGEAVRTLRVIRR
ncbi:T9SS type A sorting domain-containing protein [Lewinella sp. IMCC34183]|uniref:T9SS type A sorting domain-containing protein n=1 Tax=Lewinella sp. IMCC34183 TaxID=2248762 RepID=UPI000E282EC3|nr:T9SS type A sorting domain-containing protein [Lewinella sp. IMCC34183]